MDTHWFTLLKCIMNDRIWGHTYLHNTELKEMTDADTHIDLYDTNLLKMKDEEKH